MNHADPAYGSSYPALWWHDLQDRLQGQKARANARWGWVNPPEGRGKLIWLRAGDSVRSLLLAAELLAAIRHKRYDLRLVLTFEKDVPEIYAPRLQGLRKVAVGYGCCDRPASIKRMLRNLQPHGVIMVGDTPRENFLRLLPQQLQHTILFQQDPMPDAHGIEACYPLSGDHACVCLNESNAADVMTMLAQQQVEPSFGGIVRGQHDDMPIWVISGLPIQRLPDFFHAWLAQPMAKRSLLCIVPENYADAEAARQTVATLGCNVERLSRWQRHAMTPGSVLVVDEPRWLTAVSASANAAHLMSNKREQFWQLLAGGSACSVQHGIIIPVPLNDFADWQQLFAQWQSYIDAPFSARQAGDGCRKLFWQQRRAAEAMLDEVLQRVYDW